MFDGAIGFAPEVEYITDFDAKDEFQGIRALTYSCINYCGKPTKVFAYIGYPSEGEHLPAVVLVHGGNGTAFLPWIRDWNKHGYAAIAMSITGDFPLETNAGSTERGCLQKWNRGLFGVFNAEGFSNSPLPDYEMNNEDIDIENQWIYHAVSQVIVAGNILRNDTRIDSEKIGLVGISWGANIISILIGHDNRFAFAVPIYGSGYLTESYGYMGKVFSKAGNHIWLAEKYFKNVTMPVLWLCWNSDIPFSVNSNSKSYQETVKINPDTRISIINEMGHSHVHAWARKEPYFFADSVINHFTRLPYFKKKNGGYKVINCDGTRINSIKLYYMESPIEYIPDDSGTKSHLSGQWKTVELEAVDKVENYIFPTGMKVGYFEITIECNNIEYVTTSELFTEPE